MSLYIVVKRETGGRLRTLGPIDAPSAEAAVEAIASGKTAGYGRHRNPYVSQGRGRYFAIKLEAWQDGAFDYTKTRGIEPVNFLDAWPR